MFDLLKIEKKEDYFNPLTKRRQRGTYFYRWIGYDDEVLLFFRKLQIAAQKNGIYIKKPVSNPTESEVAYFYDRTDRNFQMDRNYILENTAKWLRLPDQNKSQLLGEAIFELLQILQRQGQNQNILKNAYIKFLCWSRYVFENAVVHLGEETLPKILWEGDCSKYEIYMMWILARAGCDVAFIHFEQDDIYLKTDPESKFSNVIYAKRRGVPPIHFSKIDLEKLEQEKRQKQELQQLEGILWTNEWMTTDFLEEAEKKNDVRMGIGTGKRICNLFVKYTGVDEKEVYQNRLFHLKEKMKQQKKPLLLLEGKILNPTNEEVQKIKTVPATDKNTLFNQMTMEIQISSDKIVNAMAKRAFLMTMESLEGMSLSQLYNHGVRYLCWMKRYLEKLFSAYQVERIPAVIYFGSCSMGEAIFLTMLSKMPLDIFVICPDKNAKDPFISLKTAKNMLKVTLPDSLDIKEFPKSEKKIKVATTAYEAERDLDQLLYTGTGLYRNRQFTRSKPVTLKTTYDEIRILWREEAKYRPNFQEEEGTVIVPNLFVKICGVEAESEGEYFRRIREMVTEETIVITRIPFLSSAARRNTVPFIKDGRILPDKIKKDANYAYDYLNEDLQAYMLEKMQELIDLNWIECNTPGLEFTILATLLNLDKKTIHMIQQFDFVGKIPKVLIVDVDEAMMGLEDCIYLSFLNLIGFDIAIFTPTGYRNIEKYIKKEAYEEFQVGKYLFNLKIPNLTPLLSNEGNGNLLFKLFRKGRRT